MIKGLLDRAAGAAGGIDGMRLLEAMAGIAVETCLLFDDPGEALDATESSLGGLLECRKLPGPLRQQALRQPCSLDYAFEQGKDLARTLFEQWLECVYDFHADFIAVAHNVIVRLELAGQPRGETLRLFVELADRCFAYEAAAQKLCDIVIDGKMALDGWSLNDGFASLSALAGAYLAVPHLAAAGQLDRVASVMTQEAARLGVPAGSDWRFGLPANDHPCTAPYDLIDGIEPDCNRLLQSLGFVRPLERAVACAKAAGRLLAVAASGQAPEIEPVIAKPLAMAAITDTYHALRRDAVAAVL